MRHHTKKPRRLRFHPSPRVPQLIADAAGENTVYALHYGRIVKIAAGRPMSDNLPPATARYPPAAA